MPGSALVSNEWSAFLDEGGTVGLLRSGLVTTRHSAVCLTLVIFCFILLCYFSFVVIVYFIYLFIFSCSSFYICVVFFLLFLLFLYFLLLFSCLFIYLCYFFYSFLPSMITGNPVFIFF